MFKKIIYLTFIIFVSNLLSFADSVRISQIDNSSLLLNQKVNLFVSITDENGETIKGLESEQFDIFESADNTVYKKNDKPINIEEGINYKEGINFLLLIDNSGSMYFDMEGNITNKVNKQRIKLSKNAIRSFLKSVTDPKDKVGIAAYNSYYTLYSKPTSDKELISDVLQDIKKPTGDEGWSEVYSSLYLTIKEFSKTKGRKALIILSDGENMPFYKYAKKEHKRFGSKIYKYTEPIEYALEEGISIYAIHFGMHGGKKDKFLKDIAVQTGGMIFDAYSEEELKSVYSKINQQILDEYLITYNAGMIPADKKYVKVELFNNNKRISGNRYYFSSTIFGLPMPNFNPLILIPFIAACLALWLLSKLKFKNTQADPSLEVISTEVGRPVTKLLTLNGGKTIIGGSKNADMTIIGNPDIKKSHASVQFDRSKKAYTVIADGDLTVNNKKVRSRVLHSGDVINVGGTTIVFDEGMKGYKK